MFDLLTPQFLQSAIEGMARSSADLVRPQLVGFVLAALYFILMARVLRYGLLYGDLLIAERARAAGQTPPGLAYWLGYAGVTLFWVVIGFLSLVGLAEIWLTIVREFDVGNSEFTRELGRRALAVSRFFW